MVKSEKAAFLDLNRSFFLNQLRVLNICFGEKGNISQDNATWAESWVLRWTPEAEIQLVECTLKGDTISQAVSFEIKERVENAKDIGVIALAIEDAFNCGMSSALNYATAALQKMAVDAVALEQLSITAYRLSEIIKYGNIRFLELSPLVPIIKQLFFRACIILPNECACDDGGSKVVIKAIEQLNKCERAHDFLNSEQWLKTIKYIAQKDDINTKISGFAAAILLEKGKMDEDNLSSEIKRRLSKGLPAALGAGYFEGLAMKNHYALIARVGLWKTLDEYLESLDDEEFKRALVFLRRAFADFNSNEKYSITENLGEIWGVDKQQLSETINSPLSKQAQELIDSLDDFDFDL